MIQVPQYQARIPISGGGGHIDLRDRQQGNPILEALKYMQQLKRQGRQDELTRRGAEADIAYRQKATQALGRLSIDNLIELWKETNVDFPTEKDIQLRKMLEEMIFKAVGIATPRRTPLIEGEPIQRGGIQDQRDVFEQLTPTTPRTGTAPRQGQRDVFEALMARQAPGGKGGRFRGRGATGTWEEPTPKVTPTPKTYAVDSYPQPKTQKAFENTIKHISDEEQANRYYQKWKHLWPGEYK